MSAPRHTPGSAPIPVLHVRTPDGRVLRMVQPFHIGREQDCEVRIDDVHVSRKHVFVSFADGRWCLRDLKSANGLFAGRQRVETAAVDGSLTVSLGIDGPSVVFELDPDAARQPRPAAKTVRSDGETILVSNYEERYFGSKSMPEQAGRRTQMIRKAFENVQKKQQRKYAAVVTILALAGLAAGGYAYYKHQQLADQQVLAQDLFYAMKSLDVELANVERLVADSGNPETKAQVQRYMNQRRQMESNYDRFLTVLNLYDRTLSEEDRLILRVTRLFGECELAAPPEYMKQVKSYIKKWQSSPRFERAIKLASQMGYTKTIADEFMQQNLPPHFFYLALQESDFDAYTSGPPTRMGYAKGMWQFIPDTGARYGLTIGPLAGVPRPDAGDDRHKWQKATHAAARYIKDIYSTDAQASGLLVMASYNWGEHRVIEMLKTMPQNPAERNFWKVLEQHRIPGQTYEYVFSIVSAAVIGENPRLFGFNLDNPLAFVDAVPAVQTH